MEMNSYDKKYFSYRCWNNGTWNSRSFALHGYNVSLYETNAEIRGNAKKVIEDELLFLLENDFIKKDDIQKTLENIEMFSDLKEAVKDADYVIEAIPEKIELKQKLFKQLDEYCKKETIFASNTSSLKLDEMSRDISEDRKKE